MSKSRNHSISSVATGTDDTKMLDDKLGYKELSYSCRQQLKHSSMQSSSLS